MFLVGQPCQLPVFLALVGSELTGWSILKKSGTGPSSFDIATILLLPPVGALCWHSILSYLIRLAATPAASTTASVPVLPSRRSPAPFSVPPTRPSVCHGSPLCKPGSAAASGSAVSSVE